MQNKPAIIISIISLVISILTFSHEFIVKEYGLLIGNTKYEIIPSEKLNIQNTVTGLSVSPLIDISNNGTVPIRINKIKVFIKFNDNHHVFNTLNTISISPNSRYKEFICFNEEYADGDQLKKDNLNTNIMNDLMSTYHVRAKIDNKTKPIFVSEKLYGEIRDNLIKQVGWMKADGNYYLLIMIWFKTGQNEPDVKSLYQFAMNDYQLRILTDYQANGMKTPNDIPGNVEATYRATPSLTIIEETDKIANVYESYKRYVVKTK